MSLVSLKAELRQQLKLSPQLLQSMEILQMNSQELLEYLGRLTEENPLLEQEDVSSLLFEPLFQLDESFQPIPLLCESYEWDETGLVCTLTLRQEAAFHDGSPLTAADVTATLRRAMVSERYAYRLRGVAAVAADRSGRVRITLTAPNRGLPALLDIPIVTRGTEALPAPAAPGG